MEIDHLLHILSFWGAVEIDRLLHILSPCRAVEIDHSLHILSTYHLLEIGHFLHNHSLCCALETVLHLQVVDEQLEMHEPFWVYIVLWFQRTSPSPHC